MEGTSSRHRGKLLVEIYTRAFRTFVTLTRFRFYTSCNILYQSSFLVINNSTALTLSIIKHSEHSHKTLNNAVRGKNLDVYEGYLRDILGCLRGYSSATFCEYLLKPTILLDNKMFELQFILYGMLILYNIYCKCSPQAKIYKKWWLF